MARKTNSPIILKRIEDEENFLVALPALAKLTLDPEGGFRGLTCFLGDGANVVVGVKRFNSDGDAQVIWSSGSDFLDALLNLCDAVRSGKWRIDKRFTP